MLEGHNSVRYNGNHGDDGGDGVDNDNLRVPNAYSTVDEGSGSVPDGGRLVW